MLDQIISGQLVETPYWQPLPLIRNRLVQSQPSHTRRYIQAQEVVQLALRACDLMVVPLRRPVRHWK